MRMEGVELMPFDKSAYDKEYAKKHITRKFIPFNDTVNEDAELLAWLATKENVTAYIKGLIQDDITRFRSQNGSQSGRQ